MHYYAETHDADLSIYRYENRAALSISVNAGGGCTVMLDSQHIQQAMLALGTLYNEINRDRGLKCSVVFEVEDCDG